MGGCLIYGSCAFGIICFRLPMIKSATNNEYSVAGFLGSFDPNWFLYFLAMAQGVLKDLPGRPW